MEQLKIEETKTVYVVWTNTDLTEGRGGEFPLAIAELKSTASRLGKGKYIQGTDCPVREDIAVRIGRKWLAPCLIHQPTKEDKVMELKSNKKQEVLEKAKKAGLSEEDILVLQGKQ